MSRRFQWAPSYSEKSDARSHHADCNNLLIGLRGFSSNHARTSQVLNPDTIVIPNDVGDDVPETDGRSDEDKYINIYLIYILSFWAHKHKLRVNLLLYDNKK